MYIWFPMTVYLHNGTLGILYDVAKISPIRI